MDKWGHHVGQGFNAYENLKKRNYSGFNGCGKMAYTFAKAGVLDGPGQRAGLCGTVKDHKRIYCCQGCFGKFFK